MPAIQTYPARNIRTGYKAHRQEHYGEVQAVPASPVEGTVTLVVDCTRCAALEVWKDIPAGEAVHAELPVR